MIARNFLIFFLTHIFVVRYKNVHAELAMARKNLNPNITNKRNNSTRSPKLRKYLRGARCGISHKERNITLLTIIKRNHR